MNKFVFAMILLAGLGMTHLLAADKPAEQPKTPATTQAAKAVNTKCPVSGDDVDPKSGTVTYKGKTIGFCCDDCIEKFNKDPDKYGKKIK